MALLSDETLRQWMIDAGLWKSKSRRLEEMQVWRPRPSGFGELVQWDTSEHDWLEGRGPVAVSGAADRRHQLELGALRGVRCDTSQHGRAVVLF